MSERQLIQPLDAARDSRSGIVTKVCEALYDAMNKTMQPVRVRRTQSSRPRARIRLTPGQLWRGQAGHGKVHVAESEGEFHNPVGIHAVVDIPYTPPNLFTQTRLGRAIPTVVTADDGSIEQKAVFFKQF